MPQSLCKIYIHAIFHIKNTSPTIANEHLKRLHGYIGELINRTNSKTVWVDGVENHVHILFLLSRDETISHLLEEVKRNSSRWIKTIDNRYKEFAWQGGYAAFSVSESQSEKTLSYIKNQQQHHKTISFQEEYIRFLNLYKIEYDHRYVFTD